jgi:hypothetical protein
MTDSGVADADMCTSPSRGLLDHPVRPLYKRLRNRQTKRLRGLRRMGTSVRGASGSLADVLQRF